MNLIQVDYKNVFVFLKIYLDNLILLNFLLTKHSCIWHIVLAELNEILISIYFL